MQFRVEEPRQPIESPEATEREEVRDQTERLQTAEAEELQKPTARLQQATEQEELREALEALARPRLVGSTGAAEAARDLRTRFEALGYEVRELPFRFSTWPGRFAVPVAGALLLVGAGAATLLLLTGRAGAAVLALLVAAALIATLAALGRAAISRLPLGRVASANWLVHRPGARPRYLVVAHRDSKSQPVSIYVRAASIVAAIGGWVLLVTLSALAALVATWQWAPLTIIVGIVTVAAGAVLLLCRAENESPGALDNATGLTALLGLARRERDNDDVAFLVTDGEELGLAGAWAAGPQLPTVDGLINLDGLDDDGDFHILEQYGLPRRGLAPHLAAALLSSAAELDVEAERRTLPVGLLVDHIAFVEAGLPAVTITRGTPDSLRRVHRPEDAADRLSGAGVVATVALVAGALRLLRDGNRGVGS